MLLEGMLGHEAGCGGGKHYREDVCVCVCGRGGPCRQCRAAHYSGNCQLQYLQSGSDQFQRWRVGVWGGGGECTDVFFFRKRHSLPCISQLSGAMPEWSHHLSHSSIIHPARVYSAGLQLLLLSSTFLMEPAISGVDASTFK